MFKTKKCISLEKNIESMNRQLEVQKTGSTSEIEMLLEELQDSTQNLNMREDKLREAEKILEEKKCTPD
jgi:chemotaxis protein MotB